MRIGWLLLFFPSFAFAVMGCPTGVPLGNVTMATRLPVCLKFEGSDLGGCLVDCKGVCVELPLANTMGPVETTGSACSLSDNGSGDGDSDGSGKTPGEGSSGTKPIDGWLDFQPVVGDATGTSVSGSVAKLNKNLGLAFRQLMDGTKRDSNNINSITHSAESFARDMKTALYHLDKMSNDVLQTKNNSAELLGGINTSNEYLNAINTKLDSLGSSSPGGDKDGDDSKLYDELKQFHLNTFGPDFAQNNIGGNFYDLVRGYQYDVNSIKESVHNLDTTFSSFHWNTSQELRNNSIEMNRNIKAIAEILKGNGGAGGDGSGSGSGDGEGSDIDYSKMPGSGDNPLAVQGSKYNSACQGKDCFFDVPAMQKKLDDANKSLTDKYTTISDDVQKVFTFSLSGSADPMECLDLFSHQGKTYSVCPPTGDYWQTLAAIMMFVFYFIALMIIFKR